MSEVKQNLHISSKVEMPGGDYQEVHISGLGTINGDLNCESLKVSGSGRINGKIKASEMKISGQLNNEGDLVTNEFKVSGSLKTKGAIHCLDSFKVSGVLKSTQNIVTNQCKVSGKLTTEGFIEANELHVSGMCYSDRLNVKESRISGITTVKNAISAHQLKVSGVLNAAKMIEAEHLKVTGRLNCEGLINAERVELEAKSGSTFEEIGASEVKIIRYESGHPINGVLTSVINSFTEAFGVNKRVMGKQIEADQIYVESATIQKISGHDIVIGPDCVIDEVEYTGTLVVDKKSTVKQSAMR